MQQQRATAAAAACSSSSSSGSSIDSTAHLKRMHSSACVDTIACTTAVTNSSSPAVFDDTAREANHGLTSF
jgi:hypothetical protein